MMTGNKKTMSVENLFAGGGETGALMRALDWSQTSLGSVENWSQSLKTAVRIMLTSRQPMFVWWGEELINLYNDAYKEIVGGKHPQALGQSAAVVWREIWDQVGPRAESAMLKNEGTYDEALLLIMERNGYPEETYYTFSYSPVPDDDGKTGGIICANTNDTQRIVGERQLVLLRELAAKTADARTFDEACTLSASCLETNPSDLPFAAIYLVASERQCVSLAGTCGIDCNHVAIPTTVSLDSDSVWSFAQVIETQQAHLVSDLAAFFPSLPTGAWNQAPHQAIVVPIMPSGQTGKAAILVVGLNPFRLFDSNYRRFIDLVAAQISASLANANAYEEERKRAETLAELDRAKTLFFSNVSHEFRTPLTLMLSPLEEILTTSDEALFRTQRQSLELVHRNGLRLLKLVNTLLDFSRIEAGREQGMYEPTDLAMLTSDLASVFRSLVEQAGLELIVDCPALPQLVYVDRDMWEKIVLNLISNAFKFTFAGGITVTLRAMAEQVELQVADTGVGIVESELARLFERFYRVSGTRSRTYEGSGIGLALVQEIVKLHGGSIRVTSVLDQGTTFTVTIPLGSAHLPSDQIQTPRTLSSTALGFAPFVEEASRWLTGNEADIRTETFSLLVASEPSARILLADDNTDMREYVTSLLSPYYQVEAVSDGVAALKAIQEHPVELVLTDVMMPKLDGFGLLRELRANPQTQDIPIILLSARAGEESRIEGLKAGADDYLVKPFSARELMARVQTTLKLGQLRRANAQQERSLRLEAQVAQARLEDVLSSIHDGFYVLDRNGCYTYVNDRFTEIVGLPKAKLLGLNAWKLFPETIAELYPHFEQTISEQISAEFERYDPTQNRWFENRIYPAAEGISVFITEITVRKQAEITLKRSEERYRAFIEQSSEAIWCFELAEPLPINSLEDEQIQRFYQHGYLSECNQKMAQMYGVASPQDLIGTKLGDYLVPSDPNNIDYLRTFIRSNYRLVDAESYEVDRQGKPKVFLNNLVGIVENGKLLRAWGTQRDITDRKLAEERLQLYADVVRNAQVGIVVWQLEDLKNPASFRLLIANPSASAMTGVDFELSIGTTMAESFPMLVQTSLVQQYREIVCTGQSVDLGEVGYGEDGITAGIYSLKAFSLPNQCLGLAFENITAQKQTETQLRETQHFNQQIAETLPGILFVYDLVEQQNVYVNRQIADLLGYTTEQVQAMGKDIVATIIHPDDLERVFAYLQAFESAPEGAILGIEYQAHHANGEWRWLYSRSVVFNRTAENLPRQTLGIAIDISDRKHLEESLRDAQIQLESALEAGAIYTWRWKILENRVVVNSAFAHLFGVDPESAADGLQLEVFINSMHEDDRVRIAAAINQAIETGEDYGAEYRVLTTNGEERWVMARGRVEYDAEGKAIAFPGALADITNRKQIEETLRQREAELRLITNTVPVLISFVDRDQRYRFNNRGYEEWFGQPTSEVYGKHLREALGETAYAAIRPYVEQVLAGEQVTFESRVTSIDGGTRDVSVTYVPRLSGRGTVEGFVALVSDISNQKRAEVERERLLAREQAAREQAEAANRIKDEFLAVLSHELRTPLNPILGWSKLLRSGNLDTTKTALALETIERNAKLQTQLIEDLLDVSRLLQGKLSLNMIPLNLVSIIEAAMETVSLAAEAKSIQLETQLDITTRQVLGDPGRLQQVVWNLLSNAIKFTPSGGRVSIRWECVDSQAQLQVSDTGRGIPASFLPYVFDYFRQADGSTTRTFGGLGLGLAIVRHLVELHGGTVQAESQGEGKGATFAVRLPLVKPQIQEQGQDDTDPLLTPALSLPLTNIRILLVDDEIDSRELVVFILEQAGARVTSVDSAIAALKLFTQSQPDILISDIGMPEMDGYRLIQQIRAMPQTEKVPALALSAYAGEIDQRLASAAGFDQHLAKPVESEELIKVIAQLTQRLI